VELVVVFLSSMLFREAGAEKNLTSGQMKAFLSGKNFARVVPWQEPN